MTGHPRTPLTQTAVLTVEADLTDWAEQHQAVALPDDDYPHIGKGRTMYVTNESAVAAR